MKRGQVTLYIIIGLVLLIIFVFLSWVSTSIRKEDVVTRIQETLDLIRVQGKYYTYVTSCIEDSTEDALILAGYQGGAIWDYQADGTRVYRGPPQYEYGIYAIPHIVAGTAYNTSYWITAPELGSEIHKDVPWYPYGLTKLVTNPRILNPSYSNMFGNYPRSPSVPLCDYFGSNSRSLSNAAACESYDSQSPRDSNSLQQYIQRYIENRSIKCIKKLEDFPELDAMNVKIGNMTANFTFDSEGVLVNAVIPVVLRPSGYSSQISLVDFTVSLPVRLKQIHELASHLVLRDINDVFFGIAQDAPTVSGCKNIAGGNAPCLKTGMGVYKISNVCPTCTKGSYDDILVIRDTESLVHGEPYEFHIAIQNRVPALDLVREELGTGSVLYDFVAFEGQEIVIEPEGRDPDEDQHNAQGFMDHTYRYYGWKETENATFVCTSEPDIHCDEWDPIHTQVLDNVPVHAWTSSQEYQDTQRTASYTVTAADRGLHNVKVEVCDEAEACDFQILTILVVSGTYAAGNHIYSDIPAGYASMEDPYMFITPLTLNAFASLNPGLSVSKLRYQWTLSGVPGWTYTNSDSTVDVPQNSAERSFATFNIAGYFSVPGDYELTADIIQITPPAVVNPGTPNTIQVKQCLPHRSASPAYPYNTVSDPFQANHTCCNGDPASPEQVGWGTIKSGTADCFRNVDYGCRDDPAFTPYGTIPTYNPSTDTGSMDVYKRTIIDTCDGIHGNRCSGNPVESRTKVLPCPECTQCRYSPSAPVCEVIPASAGVYKNGGALSCAYGENSLFNITGPYSCQGLCDNGEVRAKNCECDLGCSAECEDDSSYTWLDMECSYNCNDYLGSGATGCTFHSTEPVVCPSPFPLSYDCVEKGDYKTCPPDETYSEPIYTQGLIYTYCQQSDKCYYNVSCTSSGPVQLEGDDCPAAGTTVETTCYHNPGGSTTCGSKGKCYSADVWDITCEKGDIYACQSGEMCYNAQCTVLAGWLRVPDKTIDLGGVVQDCQSIHCSQGHHSIMDKCYYGINCTATGWEYANVKTRTGTCAGTWACTGNGWVCQ